MNPERWSQVDRYIKDQIVPHDPIFDAVLTASQEAGLPSIQVSSAQGKLLQILAQTQGASRILEIGTLGGYSTLWMAKALPQWGRLITLEIDPSHAATARANFKRAGVESVVELIEGPALETLPRLEIEGFGPFDLIFIDADKPGNPDYFSWALRLSCKGSLIIVDNVIRNGDVLDEKGADAKVQGVRKLFEMISREPRVNATAIQTVGEKGYDGFILAWVKS